jgi:hypothetical protein
MIAFKKYCIGVLLVAGACAGPTKVAARNATTAAGANLVCHEVTETGTLFSRHECTPTEDRQEQANEAC